MISWWDYEIFPWTVNDKHPSSLYFFFPPPLVVSVTRENPICYLGMFLSIFLAELAADREGPVTQQMAGEELSLLPRPARWEQASSPEPWLCWWTRRAQQPCHSECRTTIIHRSWESSLFPWLPLHDFLRKDLAICICICLKGWVIERRGNEREREDEKQTPIS